MGGLKYSLLRGSKDLDELLNRIGQAQFVLLGEASHGTSEFYLWRSEISKRLIKEKGFSFIAVEGDWPDCFEVNRYIKGLSDSKSAYDVLNSFNRWPTWMWANKEMVELVEWLRKFNDDINYNNQNKIGFYGLDLYSLWESMEEIIQYLRRVDPIALKNAIKAYNCFEPYNKEVEEYARATAFVPKNCEEEVIDLLSALRNKHDIYSKDHQNREEYFNAEQNAISAKDAERYYRIMMKGDVNSWNLRDTHMMNTLEAIIDFHSQDGYNGNPKAIVWAHNTHIGDARFTDMVHSGMVNIGQLTREKKGIHNTVLIGFSTYGGTVIAARGWGERMERMSVPSAIDGSWDNLLHNININNSMDRIKDKIIIFDRGTFDKIINKGIDYMTDENYENKGQRAIGVVYNSAYEKYGNYVPTILSLRYDALLFIDKTNALHPLHIHTKEDRDLPETFPTGN